MNQKRTWVLKLIKECLERNLFTNMDEYDIREAINQCTSDFEKILRMEKTLTDISDLDKVLWEAS